MIIKKLKLLSFRNYENEEIEFNKGVNFLVGDNASGKTNILEAINFLSLARSFKTNNIKEVIKRDQKDFYINAEINSYDDENLSNTIEMYVNNEGKKIFVNKERIHKVSELSKFINTIIFTPEDTMLLKDSPKSRRFFLNISLSKTSQIYQEALIKYEKILKARNALLKEEVINDGLIDVYTRQLIECSKTIYDYRKSFIEGINGVINEIYNDISGRSNTLHVHYLAFVDSDDYYNKAKEKFDKCYEKDKEYQMTTIGVQKEDFLISLNHKNVGIYGSQGENRLVVLALKLSLYYLKSDFKEKPIILLDDVLSELDYNHEKRLLETLKRFNQVFITGTKENMFISESIYKVENGKVYRKE